jgi:L-fuconolactonase
MIVDAHSHVWVIDPQKYPWQPVGGYIPENSAPVSRLLTLMDATGVDRAVLVQPTPYGWNNSYLLDAVRSCPKHLKAVCLVNPHAETSSGHLEKLVNQQGINGVRFNWNLEPEYSWDTDSVHGSIWKTAQDLKIPVCLQLIYTQVNQVIEFTSRYPRVHIVLDHLGRPEPGSHPDDLFFRNFLSLAKYPNVFAKLSGMYYFSKSAAPFKDTWPLLQAAVKAFGASRCLWGSDFPFILDRWSYMYLPDTLKGKLEFTHEELDFVLGRTAENLGW